MKIRLFAVLASLALITACAPNDEAGKGALLQISGAASSLKVNGQVIPEALVQAYARKRGWEVRDPGQREQVYNQLGEMLAVAIEAKKLGLLDEQSVRADLELERLNGLSGILIERNSATVSDEQLRAAYDEEVATTGSEEFQAAHILLDSAERASQVLASLAAGANIDELIAAQAGQTGVRDAKDLGWVRRTQLPPPMADALAALQPGTWSPQPIATEFGFHVAYLRAKRPFAVPAFEQVREGIRAALVQKRALEFANSIKVKAKIEH